MVQSSPQDGEDPAWRSPRCDTARVLRLVAVLTPTVNQGGPGVSGVDMIATHACMLPWVVCACGMSCLFRCDGRLRQRLSRFRGKFLAQDKSVLPHTRFV